MSEWTRSELRRCVESLDAGVSVNAEDRPHRAGEIGVLKTSALSGYAFHPEQNKAVLQSERQRVAEPVKANSILVSRMNTPALVGESCYVEEAHETLFLPDRIWQLKLRPEVSTNARWLSYVLQSHEYRNFVEIHASGTSGSMKNLSKSALLSLPVHYPSELEQSQIAAVLATLDSATRQTEAIVEKLKQLKQGLLHDLLTRGVDANGELRPSYEQAADLYQESPLGWIPRDWEVLELGDAAQSLVDGPFGSNLKTEHYVENPGVPVVRLQNILSCEYDDAERAYISESHAASLSRNRVEGGDVLIASLGDANYPVGRACCYPMGQASAINKADCFRLRGGPRCRNTFIMLFLNGVAARRQVRGYEQGVTMKRVNLGNLRRVLVSLPGLAEQDMIAERFAAAHQRMTTAVRECEKLRKQKCALMNDLLTGRVRVTPLLEAASP